MAEWIDKGRLKKQRKSYRKLSFRKDTKAVVWKAGNNVAAAGLFS